MTLQEASEKFQTALDAVQASTTTGLDTMASLMQKAIEQLDKNAKRIAELEKELKTLKGENVGSP